MRSKTTQRIIDETPQELIDKVRTETNNFMNNITEGSKLIAEYLGWRYVPFNDLQGFPKAGWYQVVPIEPNMQECTQTSFNAGDEENKLVKKVALDVNLLRYSPKNGWKKNDEYYYKYVCRNHSDLRFYNSMDALIPAIQKLQKDKFEISLSPNGAWSIAIDPEEEFYFKSFDENLSWVQNTFKVVVETIKYLQNEK